MRALFGAAIAALVLTGCAIGIEQPYVPSEHGGEGPQLFDAEVARLFPYHDSPAADLTTKGGYAVDGYTHTLLRMRSARTDREVDTKAEYLHRSCGGDGGRELMMVLSIYASDHVFPQESIVSTLRRARPCGLDILYIKDRDDPFNWSRIRGARSEKELEAVVKRSAQTMREMIVDILRWKSWAEQKGVVRTGIAGFSFGSLFAALAVGVTGDFDAAVLMMGGCCLNEIFAYYKDSDLKSIRDELLARFGWSAEDFAAKLEVPLWSVNPAVYGGRVSPESVLVFSALEDELIPQGAIRGLWEGFGRPAWVQYPSSHRKAFWWSMTPLGLFESNRRILAFLRERLEW